MLGDEGAVGWILSASAGCWVPVQTATRKVEHCWGRAAGWSSPGSASFGANGCP